MSVVAAAFVAIVAFSREVSAQTCAVGYYVNRGGGCSMAPAGTYSTGGTSTFTIPCAPGAYQPDAGRSSCILALAGSYATGPGATSATPCPAGTYQPNAGSISCTLAPAGTYVSSAGVGAKTKDVAITVTQPIDPAKDTYASSLNVDISKMTRTSSDLYYRDLTLGQGVPAAGGDSVQVDYTLWLTNGNKVDSSQDPGRIPFEFLLGQNPPHVIPGFEEGVTGMLPNGTRQLVIPPQLAFGSEGRAPIPPNVNVVVVVTYRKKF
jgi:hypothetical protein